MFTFLFSWLQLTGQFIYYFSSPSPNRTKAFFNLYMKELRTILFFFVNRNIVKENIDSLLGKSDWKRMEECFPHNNHIVLVIVRLGYFPKMINECVWNPSMNVTNHSQLSAIFPEMLELISSDLEGWLGKMTLGLEKWLQSAQAKATTMP